MDPIEIINFGIGQIMEAAAEYAPILLTIAVVLVVSFIVIKIIKALIKRALAKVNFNEDIAHLAYRVAGWAMWFLVIAWLIGILGLEAVFASLLGLGALAGLAVAMASKDSLGDVISGILILGDRHFDIGDTIETQGKTGIIEDVGLRKTRLRLEDGTLMVLGNKKIDIGGWRLLSRPKGKKI